MSRGKRCRGNKLVLFTMGGVLCGVGLGILVKQFDPSQTTLMWIGLPGELYIRFLKMLITPLLLTSVISGTSSLNANTSGKVGICTVVYFVLTNFLGCVVGCSITVLVVPGTNHYTPADTLEQTSSAIDYHDLFADVFRNLVPDNLFLATFQQTQTRYQLETKSTSINQTQETKTKILEYVEGVNVLGILTVCTLVGICAGKAKQEGEAFRAFFTSSFSVLLHLMRLFMWCTPLGLLSLLAKTVSSADNLLDDLANIAMYLVTVTVGQCLVVVVIVPAVYVIVRRANPVYLYYTLREPIMLAFATGSTAAVIPDTVRILVDEMGVDQHVAEFVVPLSTAIGRCGTSLYVSVACVFLLQKETSDYSAETVVLICLMAALLSTASPSVSGSSMAVIILIVSQFNIPSDMVGILFSTDWIIDRIRTITNYVAQVLGTIITNSCVSPTPNAIDEPRSSIAYTSDSISRTDNPIELNTLSLCESSMSNANAVSLASDGRQTSTISTAYLHQTYLLIFSISSKSCSLIARLKGIPV
ncbi:putative sodium-dependent excitatory amino acid transporter glt-3 [Pecten maximus]|uniref:putative sodium-dependent excitatory amino acid transporter glt-3 n=1 Tax=Pecten maximus TaxID=6579 RepID=UPI001458864F|nr:putative sodium-dependent excitatory amino acid transporter glt-3 [Pecten maximus]